MKTFVTSIMTLVAMPLVAMSFAAISVAKAQQGQAAPLNAPYVTSTGATVPNPGKSQSGGTTKLDRGIQHEDNKIDSSICKGC